MQSRAADWELLEMLAEYLPRRFPDRFSMAGSRLTNHSTDDCWDLSDQSQDAMETASLLVQASATLSMQQQPYSKSGGAACIVILCRSSVLFFGGDI